MCMTHFNVMLEFYSKKNNEAFKKEALFLP